MPTTGEMFIENVPDDESPDLALWAEFLDEDEVSELQGILDENVQTLRVGASSLRDAFNPCHDPKTGQFCDKGAAMGHPSSAFPKANPAGADSLAQHTGPDGKLTAERQALHDAIIAEHFKGKTPVASPSVTVLGGGPASGKSTVVNELKHDENTVKIDVDHIRTLLPEYGEGLAAKNPNISAFTHEESSMISKRISAQAASGKYNTLLDGTGDNSLESLSSKVASFRNVGARVVGVYVTTDIHTAMQRANARGDKTGRYVPESFLRASHASVSRVFPQAVQHGLFDHVTLWDSTTGGRPARILTAGKGQPTQIHDSDAWTAFVKKGEG
jgi:predicted ABC-type ATPase